MNLDKNKFVLVNDNKRILDDKFETKPVGYLKDAWRRFKKSKISIVALIIIALIFLFSIITPAVITEHDSTFMVAFYSKKPAYIESLRNNSLFDGGLSRSFSEKSLIAQIGIGVAAEDKQGLGNITLKQGQESFFQPIINYTKAKTNYKGRINCYMEVGFIYKTIEQSEYKKIVEFEKETGLNVLYPLVEKNEYNIDIANANYWYKAVNGVPVSVDEDGNVTKLTLNDNTVLSDNYKRDENGNPIYFEYAGGGDHNTASYKVRILYYNYYKFLYNQTPTYIMGTDAQGYDLALRLAGGIQLSLLIAVCICIINFVIGALYGAVEGYYGGMIDLVLERISDLISSMPFVVMCTLFQIYFAAQVGPIVSLLFAYVFQGWISTAARVRTQFYRFKNQEYVMAAKTLGASNKRIIWKHIFPNTLGTIITSSALAIPGVILSESTLSFLGIIKLGTSKITSLGTLLSDASGIWTNYPHLLFIPATVISLLMICFNLFGNGLRDAFNPSLRGVED